MSVATNPVPLQFPHADAVITSHTMPDWWAFYIQGSGLPLSFSGTWSDSIHKIHIALQELQTVMLMLHTMAFFI